MNPTKALTSLRLVTGRGMDNGAEGALLLANQVSLVVHDLEQKRATCLRAEERQKKEKQKASVMKSAAQLEREKTEAKWHTAKVRDHASMMSAYFGPFLPPAPQKKINKCFYFSLYPPNYFFG